ncbi:Murein DD-endopeptidase MepM, murein hydrolase activator NlpD [Porphyrobacter sp. LM 6]|nr:Murein DD-endopeptidase MepM, murein hydrolase activator NlpD [Porphyrobacter sp. LM 6]
MSRRAGSSLRLPSAAAALAALLYTVPLSASSKAAEASLPLPDPGEALTTPADSDYSPITIDAPVGRVQLARAGDALGERRYEARSGNPGAVIVTFARTPARRTGTGAVIGGFPTGLPLGGARLTSGFGYRFHPLSGRYQPHAGVDLAAPTGTPVIATADGVVDVAGWSGGYGLLVAVNHGGAVETRYGHLSGVAVAPGESVKKGQVIGYVGSTGRSTGPHLHYEVREGQVAVDPLR